MELKKITQLKQRVEQLQRKKDQTIGELRSLKKELKEKFGCSNIEAAKTYLAKLQREERILEKDFEKAMKTFEKQWKGKLDDDE